MTTTPKNPKLPLAKTSRQAFEKRFEEIFLKEAGKDISDEVLMKAVNDHDAKNPGSTSGQKQEAVQDEEINPGTEEVIIDGDQAGEVILDQSGKALEVDVLELTEDQVKEISAKYFDLFGAKPLQSMTTDQMLNSIAIKQEEIDNAEKPKEVAKQQFELKEGQVVAKNASGQEMVFNKQTLKFLPEWKQVAEVPNEVKNK